MSRIVKLFFFCFFLFVSSYSYSVEEKIVYLNLDYIYQKSIPGKLILEELNKNKKLNIEKFKEKESEIRATEQDLIKKKNILSKEEFDLKVRTLNEEMQKYNKSREKAFLEFDENKKKKLNDFLVKITPLIENYVKENSINIVLNQKNLFIASKKFDITDQIIQIVNENIK
jgi:Skp family chaperone for outer membrane proteins|tara:strand:+ start:4118 stop:4630 length:513 start_codon:yes stop_codon:yes gene_type:complete